MKRYEGTWTRIAQILNLVARCSGADDPRIRGCALFLSSASKLESSTSQQTPTAELVNMVYELGHYFLLTLSRLNYETCVKYGR